MANGLVPSTRKPKPDFFRQFLSPDQREEDEGFFGLDQYRPLPEFERPARRRLPGGGYPIDSEPGGYPLALATGLTQREDRAPAPGRVIVPGGGIPGVSTGTFTGQPIRVPYSEQYRQQNPKPELAPAPKLSKKRRIGAALAAFAAEFGRPGTGHQVGQQILYGPREQAEAEHERKTVAWKSGLEEARERDIAEGRRIQRESAEERLSRLRQTPIPRQKETDREAFERRKREAADLSLEPGSPEYLEYVSERDLGPAPQRPETIRRTLPGGKTQFLERQQGEEYFQPSQMLAPGVEDVAPPITYEHGGVGGQPLQVPGPRPPAEAVVSHPRPTRPTGRDLAGSDTELVQRTAQGYLSNAGSPATALQWLEEDLRKPGVDPDLLRLAGKIRNQIQDIARGVGGRQGGSLEEDINRLLPPE